MCPDVALICQVSLCDDVFHGHKQHHNIYFPPEMLTCKSSSHLHVKNNPRFCYRSGNKIKYFLMSINVACVVSLEINPSNNNSDRCPWGVFISTSTFIKFIFTLKRHLQQLSSQGEHLLYGSDHVWGIPKKLIVHNFTNNQQIKNFKVDNFWRLL